MSRATARRLKGGNHRLANSGEVWAGGACKLAGPFALNQQTLPQAASQPRLISFVPAAEGLSHQTVQQLPGKALHQPALTQVHQRTHLQGIGRRREVAEG